MNSKLRYSLWLITELINRFFTKSAKTKTESFIPNKQAKKENPNAAFFVTCGGFMD